jgi:transposase
MAKMTRADLEAKKTLAFTLYVDNGFEQKLIAEKLGVTEKTISKWKQDGKWEDARQESRTGISNRRKRILATLDLLLKYIEDRDPPKNVPDSKESDTITKLTAAIQNLETELSTAHKTETGKLFVNYIQRTYGKDEAVRAVDLWHEFIMATT